MFKNSLSLETFDIRSWTFDESYSEIEVEPF